MPSTGNSSILFALKRLEYVHFVTFWRLMKRTRIVGCLLTGLPVGLGLNLGICGFRGKRRTVKISSPSSTSSCFARSSVIWVISSLFSRGIALKLRVLLSIVLLKLVNFQFIVAATFAQIIRLFTQIYKISFLLLVSLKHAAVSFS